jgi:hypothetical protein
MRRLRRRGERGSEMRRPFLLPFPAGDTTPVRIGGAAVAAEPSRRPRHPASSRGRHGTRTSARTESDAVRPGRRNRGKPGQRPRHGISCGNGVLSFLAPEIPGNRRRWYSGSTVGERTATTPFTCSPASGAIETGVRRQRGDSDLEWSDWNEPAFPGEREHPAAAYSGSGCRSGAIPGETVRHPLYLHNG